jgi:hypothetical protein
MTGDPYRLARKLERQEIVDNPDRRNPWVQGAASQTYPILDRGVLAENFFSCLRATRVNPRRRGYPLTATGTGKAGILDVY